MVFDIKFKIGFEGQNVKYRQKLGSVEALEEAQRVINAIIDREKAQAQKLEASQQKNKPNPALGVKTPPLAATPNPAPSYVPPASKKREVPAEPPKPTAATRGAKGLLRLTCRKCGAGATTFLHEPQEMYVCKACGYGLALDQYSLARFEFTCPDCGKTTYGRTNRDDAGFTISCPCGKEVDLEWSQKLRYYRQEVVK